MKGLLLSVFVFVLYVALTTLISHVFSVRRHSKMFVPAFFLAVVFYMLAFVFSPPNLWFLGSGWLARCRWLDFMYGAVALFLNIHNFFYYIFGFNGGFSTSLMLLLHRSGKNGTGESELIKNFRGSDGVDKIYGWRMPRLEETGYIRIDKETQVCMVTAKGAKVARITRFFKRILNLGAGG